MAPAETEGASLLLRSRSFINQVMNVSVASYWSDFITGDNKDPA